MPDTEVDEVFGCWKFLSVHFDRRGRCGALAESLHLSCGLLVVQTCSDGCFSLACADECGRAALYKQQDWHHASILGLSMWIGVRIISTKTAPEKLAMILRIRRVRSYAIQAIEHCRTVRGHELVTHAAWSSPNSTQEIQFTTNNG